MWSLKLNHKQISESTVLYLYNTLFAESKILVKYEKNFPRRPVIDSLGEAQAYVLVKAHTDWALKLYMQ